MAKKDKHRAAAAQSNAQPKEEKPATLKDLLRPDVLDKLKATAQDLKSAEEQRKEDLRRQEEEARKAEQKRLDNDFEYLLNNSKLDWRSNKG
ncbi:YqkE family protein [Paenibacillus glycinis]|uniref:DUF3886 domain-containing protein n=1 Tax=Paenibacillus glycinis TaxID=2697035 RepID=A0ABW9XL31_9BACL|nr:YqkE family protein [Paenibacillus glycinis]NBD23344.1 DUF3886 domain-containing protein [Paenibacillus glycinis]